MTGKIGTLELTIHPVLPLYMGLMLAIGAGKFCAIAFFCVALHELAHILQPDHSPAFYAVVASVMPDWQMRRELLRQVR